MRPMIKSLKDTEVGVEVGVFKGEHALSILQGLPNLKRLYLIDPYEAYEGYDDPNVGMLKSARKEAVSRLLDFKDRIRWIYSKFETGLIDEKVDFVYIDGNHDPHAVMHDIKVAETIIKPRGIIGGHDYYESSHLGVKMTVDNYCREKNRVLYQEDIDWWVMPSPRVFFFNFNVGSGIERAGNLIMSLLEGYDVVEYKSQNPPCIIIDSLQEAHPHVIIMNEYYPRTITAAYYYKKCNPEVKVVLLNHCYDRLVNLPLDPDMGDDILHRDGRVLVNYFFNNVVDAIITLNYHPEGRPYPKRLKVIDQLFPIDDKFKITTRWKDRTKDFFYYGNLIPLKFSKEFAEKCDIPVDIIGKPKDTEYFKTVMQNPSFHEQGFIPEEQLVDTLNQYRFLVVPHSGSEPFNLCIAEAIRCGCIVLLTNKREGPRADWIDWAKGCYVEYATIDDLLSGMHHYLERKDDKEFIEQLDRDSLRVSKDMTQRTSCEDFKNILDTII